MPPEFNLFNMKKNKLFLVALIAIIYSSCTVEKRHYMSGYHVEWHHKTQKTTGSGEIKIEEKQITSLPSEEHVMTAAPIEEKSLDLTIETAPATVTQEQFTAPANKKQQKQNQPKQELKASSNTSPLSRSVNATRAEKAAQESNENSSSFFGMEPSQGLLILLAIFIPPLAVYLYEGNWTSRCTVNLILTLLCGIPGVIHALVVVLGNK